MVAAVNGADSGVCLEHSTKLSSQQGRCSFFLIADASRRAPRLIGKARADNTKVLLTSDSGGPGQANSGGAQRPGDLRVYQQGLLMGGGQGRRLVVQNTGMGLSAANAQRTGNNRQIAVGLAPQGGGYPRPLYGQGFAALVVQNFYFLRDKLVSAVSRCQRPRARCIRAAFSKGGSSIKRPLRSSARPLLWPAIDSP